MKHSTTHTTKKLTVTAGLALGTLWFAANSAAADSCASKYGDARCPTPSVQAVAGGDGAGQHLPGTVDPSELEPAPSQPSNPRPTEPESSNPPVAPPDPEPEGSSGDGPGGSSSGRGTGSSGGSDSEPNDEDWDDGGEADSYDDSYDEDSYDDSYDEDWDDDDVSASPRSKGTASTSSDAAVPAAVALGAAALTGSAFALGRRRSDSSSHSEIQ